MHAAPRRTRPLGVFTELSFLLFIKLAFRPVSLDLRVETGHWYVFCEDSSLEHAICLSKQRMHGACTQDISCHSPWDKLRVCEALTCPSQRFFDCLHASHAFCLGALWRFAENFIPLVDIIVTIRWEALDRNAVGGSLDLRGARLRHSSGAQVDVMLSQL